jgi:predicted PurR-regulated permease PerM
VAKRRAESAGESARPTFFVLGSIGLVVAALYLGQTIFVPFALAVLLTLVLGPAAVWLERQGMGRGPAVLSTAGLAFLLIGLGGWAVAAQVTSLLGDLPELKTNIREKIHELAGPGKPGPLGAFQEFIEEIETGAPTGQLAPQGPVIRVEPARPSLISRLHPLLGRAVSVVSAAVAVALLVIALLLYREDTRNRLIRLAGQGRLTVTTRALDEAGRRIGGYLLGHAAVNAGFGAAVAVGLYLLGVPYPLLWGMLAAAFRFIPAVGVWLVAPFPAALAFINGIGLIPPALVLGLFLVLNLLTSSLVEPRVCGKSVGLAAVPLLLAIALWTALWGLIGLVLATPVTVCLAVLGRHVRQLRPLALLLGKEEALRPSVRYYQRLLARDGFEAEEVVKEYLAEHTIEDLFDRVMVPALMFVRRGRKAGELQPEDEEFILRTTMEIIGRLVMPTDDEATGGEQVTVLGIPVSDGADEAALAMLRALLRKAGTGVLVSATVPHGPGATANGAAPSVVLVSAVGPGGLTEARYLCRRLRDQHPGVKIVVGRWGQGKDPKKARTLLLSAGADRVAAALREARGQLARLVRPQPAPTDAEARAV